MGGCRNLTDLEVKSILEMLHSKTFALRDRALFLLGIRTGFRISELLSLTVENVWQGDHVPDLVTVQKRAMKGKREGRSVKLHPEAKEAIRLWICQLQAKSAEPLDPKTYLFKSREGGNRAMTRKNAWAILKTAYKKCGLEGKLGTHSMRKTFAKRVFDKSGGNIFKTQQALGHADPKSTTKYLQVNQDEIDDLVLNS